ncbi:MAG: RNA polymerase sigma factor [Bacteroidales bacterium]|nr:RNA polymerase sigma factor [Bacteroidales bacterium]
MTDSELINSLLSKDENAFRFLVEKYKNMVFKACFHILNNAEDAEDIAQEVFIEAFLSISGFRGDAKLSTWLYRISLNKSKNLLRKNRWQQLVQRFGKFITGEKSEFIEIEDHAAREAMHEIERTEEQQILWRAIDSLPENQRIAFTLNKYEELSYQEIADVMMTSVSAVESLIHRGKLNLQKKLLKQF